MRLKDGKLRNGGELKHLPPLYMQSKPLSLDLTDVRRQIFLWQEAVSNNLDRSVIHTEAALEISSWWASTGNAFSAFAFNGVILTSLKTEISDKKAEMEHESSQQALDALYAYITQSETKKDN